MEDAPRRWPRPWIAAGVGSVVLAGGAVWLWTERAPIAASYIDDALTARDVPASYRLTRIGFRTQRIEAIRIGDPRNPDLTADWAEIELSVGLAGVSVRAIDAGGVRLRGRWIDGKVSLGAIDRLLPAGESDQPFTLPDIALTARAMRLDLMLPQGLIQARLDGKGGLKDGFQGTLAVGSDRLAAGGCTLSAPRASLALAIDDGHPLVRGPIEATDMACADALLSAPRLDLAARGDTDLARWRGDLTIKRGRLVARDIQVGGLGGSIGFDASAAKVAGKANLLVEQANYAAVHANYGVLRGNYSADPRAGSIDFAGEARVSGAKLDPALAGQLVRQMASAEGMPIAPILAAWAVAIQRATRSIDGAARFAMHHDTRGGVARIERFEAKAARGGHLLVRGEGAEGFGWRWPKAGPVVNASVELDGGDLPRLVMSVRQAVPGAPLTGSATLAPYQAGGARLRLAPIIFGPADRGGTAITTRATLDGPLADGNVSGLDMPISIWLGHGGAFAVNRRCAPLGFERLAIAGTVIGRSSLPVCPVGGALVGRGISGPLYGGGRIAAPRLRGRVGDQPLTMEARSVGFRVAQPGFTLNGLAVRLGDPAAPTRLDVTSVDGAISSKGFAGRLEGAAGKIGAVPLLISEGVGGWRLAGSSLSLDGAIRVADAEQADPRFHPLMANDVRLTLKNGRIEATTTLREPLSAVPVAKVAIRHDLSSGKGDAVLDVDDLRFGKALQPEAITPLTLGMIANVEGAVAGQGRIRWSEGAVTSDGTFRTDGLNLAAAFGPVTGLKGVIRFTDLLGLVTAPDQRVTIAEINPGISVTNGVIRYAILPDRKLAVADGAWPFAGGALTLEPTVLDMGQPVARRLTFRIDGLDAATFVQQLDFKNLAVTGKFDGTLPIIFDAQGGRIENGLLRVRPPGGTLSYVGDVTNAELGSMARIAFDALKSMRYQQLTIDLNGSLDGEIVSRVRFDGTNDKPQETAKNGGIIGRILAPITRLPFRFNITITAPFRGLVNSAQTFIDPSIVLRNTQGTAAQPVPTAPAMPAPVQPPIQPR
ncbi:YdbH domain-containing protein [Sphingomonas sp. SRS2]|uniref:YdbH domain-containing protein n=1 Tax=Sphingomonas sp. SRS2 TaxID=133190 RepID=UPI000618469C|nr:YdbH domain-containing protein [Sphingomonas sp. SRS2]KKC27809.1 hypothetical protein WP12_01125 [Sphingomonas sp. SRS2]